MDEPLVAATLRSKQVLVTGSGTGVGRGIAYEFGRAGASVAVHYSSSGEGAESVAAEINEIGGKACVIQADLRSIDGVRKLAGSATALLGGVDILINNSGITLTKPFEEVTPDDFDTIYNVNIRAMFFLTQFCLPGMVERGGGVVINISSVHAATGLPEHTVYAGTKGAIVSFTRTLAMEVAKKGVYVYGIAPGWVLVEKHIEAMPVGFDLEAAEGLIPAGFIARPRDVGRLAVFMASGDARYMVGHTLMFDGGQTAVQALADRITELYQGKLPSKVQ